MIQSYSYARRSNTGVSALWKSGLCDRALRLYAIYIDGLHEALRAKGLGVRMFGRLVPMLKYADDLVRLAEDQEIMRQMLKVLEEYATKWRFDVNHGKTNLLVMGPGAVAARAAAESIPWVLCGAPIEFSEVYRYLGVEVAPNHLFFSLNCKVGLLTQSERPAARVRGLVFKNPTTINNPNILQCELTDNTDLSYSLNSSTEVKSPQLDLSSFLNSSAEVKSKSSEGKLTLPREVDGNERAKYPVALNNSKTVGVYGGGEKIGLKSWFRIGFHNAVRQPIIAGHEVRKVKVSGRGTYVAGGIQFMESCRARLTELE